MSDLSTIGEAVRKRRKELGLSQQELAELANVARNTDSLIDTLDQLFFCGQMSTSTRTRKLRISDPPVK